LAAAGAVVVAVVPCCCVQEATNAIPISAVIKHNTYLFIGCQFQFESHRMFGCLKVRNAEVTKRSRLRVPLGRLFLRHKLSNGAANFAKQKPIHVERSNGETLKVATNKEEAHENDSFFERRNGTCQAALAEPRACKSETVRG
jgi:hypothetical protein